MCDGGVRCEGSEGCGNSMLVVCCWRPTHFDTRMYFGIETFLPHQ